jgi:glycosyltransferase involved in cell wall biosynthesis
VNYQVLYYKTLRLHLTNVTGVGSSQLLLSLLPALERYPSVEITEIHLPDKGHLSNYQKLTNGALSKRYRRLLPNALSRIFECLYFARNLNGDTPLLVLGDIPLRCRVPQTVFVQNPHLLIPLSIDWSFDGLKFATLRLLFRLNARYVNSFIVQTSFMNEALAASYPDIANKIHIIAQPVPVWLLDVTKKNNGAHRRIGSKGLRLIYPAVSYPHKNHKLLAYIKPELGLKWPVECLKITLHRENHPAPDVSWIQCVGVLSAPEMIQAYLEVDALLFLLTDESYGFPLIEAMYMGIPVVCPDLPYAHELCSEGAIYFDPNSIASLHEALGILNSLLLEGWWPDWTKQLSILPKNWDVVADSMIAVSCA